MSIEARNDDLLATAFTSFERAAVQLQRRHAGLRGQVERLERELVASNRRLETVLEALEIGVAVMSDRGEILRANRAFAETGLAGERSGRTLPELARLADIDPVRRSATRLRHSTTGGERDLAVTVNATGDDEGTRVITVQDVTDIRREEEEGGRRRRLEALGRMAAEIAHEVRNPLGSIRLFASLLRDDLREHNELSDLAEQILRSSSDLEATVSNLLAFASPSESAKREIDLAALAVETCALVAPACSLRGVKLQAPEPPKECRVWADPEGLRQVLLNLLRNSLAATGEDGHIQVETSRDGGDAVVVVEDTGGGIAPEDLPRVFDPFFSRSEGGTGLGLSIVHGIVERHDGGISVDSGPDRGTRVRVEIPINAPTGAASGGTT